MTKPAYEELEAQCAAMREALGWFDPGAGGCHCEGICDACDARRYAALSSGAGREFLDRLEKAKDDAYDKVQALAAVSTILCGGVEVPDSWDRYGAVQDARATVERLEKAERPNSIAEYLGYGIRAIAFEEAAKVLDAEAQTLPDLPSFNGPNIPGAFKTRILGLAAKIRALKEKP